MIEYMGCWAIAPRQIPVGWPQCIEIIKFDLPAPPKLHGFSYEKKICLQGKARIWIDSV